MKKLISVLLMLCMTFSFAACGNATDSSSADTGSGDSGKVTIAIGYQTVTAQTWGPLIMKNKGFLEEELAAKYPDTKFSIDWQNAQSGPPLTNNMIAGKLQFAVMGDMPILTNGEKGQTEQNYSSVFIGFDGKGKDGMNQAILIPNESDVTSVADLAGKEVATPIGGSAHRMLLLELEKNGIADKVKIVSQDATVGLSNIEQNKVAAFSIWEPFASLAEEEGYGKVLVGGEDTGVDYLDGIVADRKWVEEHKDYTVCFLKALIRSHQFIRENPEEAAKIFAEETGYSESVCAKIVGKVRFDTVIYDKDVETLKGSKDFLVKIGSIKDVDLEKFVDDSYLRKAFEELGIAYPSDEALKGDWLPLK